MISKVVGQAYLLYSSHPLSFSLSIFLHSFHSSFISSAFSFTSFVGEFRGFVNPFGHSPCHRAFRSLLFYSLLRHFLCEACAVLGGFNCSLALLKTLFPCFVFSGGFHDIALKDGVILGVLVHRNPVGDLGWQFFKNFILIGES